MYHHLLGNVGIFLNSELVFPEHCLGGVDTLMQLVGLVAELYHLDLGLGGLLSDFIGALAGVHGLGAGVGELAMGRYLSAILALNRFAPHRRCFAGA